MGASKVGVEIERLLELGLRDSERSGRAARERLPSRHVGLEGRLIVGPELCVVVVLQTDLEGARNLGADAEALVDGDRPGPELLLEGLALD